MRAPEPVVLARGDVRLEPLSEAHVEDLLPVAQDPEVWRWLSAPQPHDGASMTAVIEAAVADPDRVAWAVLLGHAFDALGAQRVTLKLAACNGRSFRAVERLGARYDGTLRHHKRRSDGTVRDSAYFSILAAEWPGVRDRLRARL